MCLCRESGYWLGGRCRTSPFHCHCHRKVYSHNLFFFLYLHISVFLSSGVAIVLAFAAQAIPAISTHFSITWSVCRLSSVTLLKAFEGMMLFGMSGPVTQCVIYLRKKQNSQPKCQTINTMLVLVNKNEKLCGFATVIPPMVKSFWCLFRRSGRPTCSSVVPC